MFYIKILNKKSYPTDTWIPYGIMNYNRIASILYIIRQNCVRGSSCIFYRYHTDKDRFCQSSFQHG